MENESHFILQSHYTSSTVIQIANHELPFYLTITRNDSIMNHMLSEDSKLFP